MTKRLFIGLVISGACLYFAFRGISVHDLAATLEQADLRWILVAIAIYLTGFALRATRWAILIRPLHHVRPAQLFWLLVLGFFANNILPFRMGELVRAHLTGKKLRISRTAALGTILVERLCDAISFLASFLIVTLFFPFPPLIQKAASGLGVLCAGLIAALVVIQRHAARFQGVLQKTRLSDVWKNRLHEAIAQLAQGVSGINRGKPLVLAIVLSASIWTLEGTFLFVMARAFGTLLAYPHAFFLLFFLGLSVSVPQAPGYVGTLELFGVMALALLGIAKERALPLIVAIHGTQFILILILGFLALWKEGLSFRKLSSTSRLAADHA